MKRCHVCGFKRDRGYFTTRPLPNGTRSTLCKQCAQTYDALYAPRTKPAPASN